MSSSSQAEATSSIVDEAEHGREEWPRASTLRFRTRSAELGQGGAQVALVHGAALALAVQSLGVKGPETPGTRGRRGP